MTQTELEHALRCAADAPGCVELVTRYFAQHPLHYGHGTSCAADEAYWLVRGVQDWDEQRWREPPSLRDRERIAELASARVMLRKPLAYLLGEAWFAGLKFEVDERVLVPRSPLAELIEAQFAPWCVLEAGDRLLDVGTGSGCIAIACAVHCPGLRVDATDCSPEALERAAANAARLAPDAALRFIEADLFPPPGDAYRLIVSNPPYVPDAAMSELPAEYLHEPRAALAAGEEGLDVVRRIVTAAGPRLEPDGVLIVEVGEAADAFVAAFPALPVTWLEFERGGDGVFAITREELTVALSS